jgi:hypothetical protein
LYEKLKENDFIGIRARGKKIWMKEDFIQIGIIPPDANNSTGAKSFPDTVAGEWYDDQSGADKTPSCTSWVKIDKEGNIDIEMEGSGHMHITGDHKVEIDGGLTVKIGADAKIEVGGSADVTVSGSAKLTSPDVTITGGQLTVGGSCAVTGQGGFCGIPNCLLTSAPHVGHVISGT